MFTCCRCLMLIGVLLLAISMVSAKPLALYVSPDGQGDADGLADKTANGHGPLDSITSARDAIRKLKTTGQFPLEGVMIHVASGTYPITEPVKFDKQDSGTAQAPIIYRGIDKPIMTGSVVLMRPMPLDDLAIALLPQSSQMHVLCFDLTFLDNHDMPGFRCGGAGFAAKHDDPFELSQHNQCLTLARWPNDGYAKTGTFEGDPITQDKRKRFESGVFHLDAPNIKQWQNEPDMWLNGWWYWLWADQRMQVQAVDAVKQTIAIKDPQTHRYGFLPGRPFFVFNAISEIDMPGEWVIDRVHQRLYVWPAHDVAQYPLSLSVTENLVQLNSVQHLRFEGIQFTQSRGDAILAKDSSEFVFSGCVIRQTGANAVRISGGKNGLVIGCDMDDLGEGGVLMSGGDLTTLTPANHRVENCYIHHYGRNVATYQAAIRLGGVGCVASHNLIHDAKHCAILYDGNEHLIEYNIMHDVLQFSDDAGAIYTCARNWAKRGNVVRFNLVHGLGKPQASNGCRGIYLDDYTSDTQVYGNIVTTASDGIYIGGGQDNQIDNNLLIDCSTSIRIGNRSSRTTSPNSPIFKATQSYPIETDTWKQRYPNLKRWMNVSPVAAHCANGNTVTSNIAVNSGALVIQNKNAIINTLTIENNLDLKDDPGFVDVSKLDLRFNPDASVHQQIVSFKPIPFEKMGLYDSPERATLSRRYGPNVMALPVLKKQAD